MAKLAAFAGASMLVSLIPGCPRTEETGFVEIKRVFAPASSRDTYRLNGEDVAGLNTTDPNASVVIRQKTGPAKLELYRDEFSHWVLCSFEVGKNRIVTATIFLQNRDIKCGVQS